MQNVYLKIYTYAMNIICGDGMRRLEKREREQFVKTGFLTIESRKLLGASLYVNRV